MKSSRSSSFLSIAVFAMLSVSAQDEKPPVPTSLMWDVVGELPLIDGDKAYIALQGSSQITGRYRIYVGTPRIEEPDALKVFAKRVDAWLLLKGGTSVPHEGGWPLIAQGVPCGRQSNGQRRVVFNFAEKLPRDKLAGIVISIDGKLHAFTISNTSKSM